MYYQQCNKMYDIKLGLLVLFISVTVLGHALSLSLSLSVSGIEMCVSVFPNSVSRWSGILLIKNND